MDEYSPPPFLLVFVTLLALVVGISIIFSFDPVEMPSSQRLVCYNKIGNPVLNEKVSRVYFGEDYIRYYVNDAPYMIKDLGCYTTP